MSDHLAERDFCSLEMEVVRISWRDKRETAREINAAMRRLYDRGARRLRTIMRPNTGDSTSYVVMGWAR